MEHVREGLNVAPGIIQRVVGVFGFAQMLEVFEGVFNHSLIEGAQVGRGMTEGVASQKLPEVEINERPVEPIVIGNEHRSFAGAYCF